jgi:hypothetical protein
MEWQERGIQKSLHGWTKVKIRGGIDAVVGRNNFVALTYN